MSLQAAPFTGADDPGSVSSRIATSFTKTARLTWKPFGVPARPGHVGSTHYAACGLVAK